MSDIDKFILFADNFHNRIEDWFKNPKKPTNRSKNKKYIKNK